MMFPIVVKEGVKRGPLVNYLEQRGVETRFMSPLLNQPFYKKLFGDLDKSYPGCKVYHNGSWFLI
jgi:hypothetical protein